MFLNSSKNVFAYEKLAKCFVVKSDTENAIKNSLKAFEYGSRNIETYIDYANIMTEKKEYQKALNKLKDFYNPDNHDILNLQFHINFLLAKEENSNYNREKAIEIAKVIEEKNIEFKYAEELGILNQR